MRSILSMSSIHVFVIVFLDQISKYFVQKTMYHGQSIQLTTFFNITFVTNTGVAFSMFQGANRFFIIFTVLVLAGMYFWYKKYKNDLNSYGKASVFLILSGAIGNLLDRIVYGHVIDFIDVHIKDYHWPAFNVADSCISIGGIILFIYIVRSRSV